MLWRASQPSRLIWDAAAPEGTPEGVLVGCRSLDGVRDLAVWRRLIVTSLPEVALRTLLLMPSDKRAKLAGAFPPSEFETFQAAPDEAWISALTLSPDDTTFAAMIRDRRVVVAVIGGPTDSGWDALEAAVSN